MLLALADTQNFRFMQTVDLVLVGSPLPLDLPEEFERVRVADQGTPGQLALDFPDEHPGHSSDTFDDLAACEALPKHAGAALVGSFAAA